jgi:hypothetical protein
MQDTWLQKHKNLSWFSVQSRLMELAIISDSKMEFERENILRELCVKCHSDSGKIQSTALDFVVKLSARTGPL